MPAQGGKCDGQYDEQECATWRRRRESARSAQQQAEPAAAEHIGHRQEELAEGEHTSQEQPELEEPGPQRLREPERSPALPVRPAAPPAQYGLVAAEPSGHGRSRGMPPGVGPRLLKRGVSVLPSMLSRVAALPGAPLKLEAGSEPAPPTLGTVGAVHQDEVEPERRGIEQPRSQTELGRAQSGGTRPPGCEAEEDGRTRRRGQTGEQLPLPQSDGNKEQAAAQERASRATEVVALADVLELQRQQKREHQRDMVDQRRQYEQQLEDQRRCLEQKVQQQAPSAVLPVVGSAPQMLAVRQPLTRVPKVVEQWEKKRLTEMDGFLEWMKDNVDIAMRGRAEHALRQPVMPGDNKVVDMVVYMIQRSIDKVKFASVVEKDQLCEMIQELESRHRRWLDIMETKLHRDFSSLDNLDGRSLEAWLAAAHRAVRNLAAVGEYKTDRDLRRVLLEATREHPRYERTVTALECRGFPFNYTELLEMLQRDDIRATGNKRSTGRGAEPRGGGRGSGGRGGR